MTEREWMRTVMQLARMRGWRVAHVHDSRRQVAPGVFVGDKDSAGLPDLLLAHERYGVVFAELKTGKGKLRPAQEEWLYSLQRAGARAYVWRPSDLPDVARVLAGHAVAAPPIAPSLARNAAPLRRGGAATPTPSNGG